MAARDRNIAQNDAREQITPINSRQKKLGQNQDKMAVSLCTDILAGFGR